MTMHNDTTGAADRLRDTAQAILQVCDLPTRVAALDAKIDAAIAHPEQEVDPYRLRRERDLIAIAEGGAAGRLTARIAELGEHRLAVIHANQDRAREEAKIIYEREIDDMQFVMDDQVRFAFTDYLDETKPIWEFDERQTRALSRFWYGRAIMLLRTLAKEANDRATSAPASEAKAQRRDAYVERVLTYSRDTDPYPTMTEIHIAPNCDGDILSHPPRIIRDHEGFQRLELRGDDGWKEYGVVEEVTRLERYELVLVATDTQAFLMTAQDFDNPIE
jgi:hypothetical protein